MPLTASAVFILNAKGDSIIHRVYRDEVERDFAEAFRSQVLTNEEAAPKPVHQVGETTFMYTRVNNL
jgi:AP-2 complex subunit mu-1